VADANAAFFDSANAFRGCIAGLHEVLRRQGLLEGTWCLDPHECLSPGQSAEIELPRMQGGVVPLTISVDAGFYPREVDASSTDPRFLGIWVEVKK